MLGREAQITGAFRLKALVLCLEAQTGARATQKMLETLKTGSIYEDETQPISVELWVRALDAFRQFGSDLAFAELPRYMVHQANLAAWSPILRGASGPAEVYSALGTTVTEVSRVFLWSTVEVHRRSWIGELELADAVDERARRLLELALGAELKSVPILFGRPQAHAECLGWRSRRVRFQVTWQEAPRALAPLPTLVSAVAALSTGAAAWVVLNDIWYASGVGLSIGGVTGAANWLMGRDAQHRASAIAQRYRILALERESSLNRHRSSEVSRPHEEPVIASQYRVGEQLGVGAAGAVWEGQRLTDGKEVAIKLLRTAVASDGRATDRLRREAEALGLAWHPSVVEVYDQGLLPSGVAFLVMERLRGHTLAEHLQIHQYLSVEEVVRWGIEASEALFAIHSAGVVHRDIKPSNIFLHDTDGQTILKLFDFGVAQVSWAETRLTRSETAIGTKGYASPEQEEGEEVDARSDIYSLGVTLLECLTGNGPPASRSGKRIIDRVEEESPQEQRLRTVLNKMTAPEKERRYSNAREVRSALYELREQRSTPMPSSPHVA